jgi:rhamnose transport system permease protein
VIPTVRSHRIEASIGLAILVIGLGLAVSVPAFFRPGNLIDLLLANLPILIVALGVTLVLLAGQIDISSGSLFAVCSVAAGALAVRHVPVPLAVASSVLIGASAGAASGALVAYASVPSIVVTLAAMVALRDGLRWITQGAWVAGLPPTFQWLGLTQVTYPFAAIALTAALTIGIARALRFLRLGRAIYATGSSPQAARLAAIDIRAVTLGVFVAAGGLTGLAAVVNAARFNQVPSNSGLGLELRAIAAVVVGGTAISGGRGTILGTVLGVVLLGLISPALTFLGASPYWEQALQGAIVLTAVVVDALGARRATTRHATRVESHRAHA